MVNYSLQFFLLNICHHRAFHYHCSATVTQVQVSFSKSAACLIFSNSLISTMFSLLPQHKSHCTLNLLILYLRKPSELAAEQHVKKSIHNLMLITEPLPCERLAPDPLWVHTSWRAYSSLLLGPECSPAHQWGVPWWRAHPHLEGGMVIHMQLNKRKHVLLCTFCGSTLTLLITHKEQGELESFLWPHSKERLLSG